MTSHSLARACSWASRGNTSPCLARKRLSLLLSSIILVLGIFLQFLRSVSYDHQLQLLLQWPSFHHKFWISDPVWWLQNVLFSATEAVVIWMQQSGQYPGMGWLAHHKSHRIFFSYMMDQKFNKTCHVVHRGCKSMSESRYFMVSDLPPDTSKPFHRLQCTNQEHGRLILQYILY